MIDYLIIGLKYLWMAVYVSALVLAHLLPWFVGGVGIGAGIALVKFFIERRGR